MKYNCKLQNAKCKINFCTLKIGNIRIKFYCQSQSWITFIKKHYRSFLTSDTKGYKVSLQNSRLNLKIKGLKVTEKNDRYEIQRNDFYSFSGHDFARTSLDILKNKYSFDSWLRVFFTLLAIKNKGALLHSSGVYLKQGNHSPAAYLFPGISGKGKSTVIRILGKETALSDELVYIFKNGRSFHASSTPFWGELKKGTGKLYSLRISALYFINHGRRNALNKLTFSAGIKKLLKTALFFSSKPSDLQKLLDLLEECCVNVPAYDLYFQLQSTKKELIDLFGGKNNGN